jgi:hypothetical protein
MLDGSPVAACSKDSVPTSVFAKMLAEAGVQEAILLDSGFSTSLVYGEKIMASGHSTPTTPSRPVPHAIIFRGEPDPASRAVADAAIPATSPDVVATKHRRRKRRAVALDPGLAVSPQNDNPPPPTDPNGTVPDPGSKPPDVPPTDPGNPPPPGP